MAMEEITSGLGSMSAMIIIMSIVAIGAIMAVRNKIANKRRRRTQAEEPSKPASKQPPTETRPNRPTESNVESFTKEYNVFFVRNSVHY